MIEARCLGCLRALRSEYKKNLPDQTGHWEMSEIRNETRVHKSVRRTAAATSTGAPFNQNGHCWKKKSEHELDGFDNRQRGRTTADKQQRAEIFFGLLLLLLLLFFPK